MSGRKVFTAGEVLQAADVNDYLMDQSVMVFAGTAARGSAIPSPSEGMVTYLEDADEVQVYTTDWGAVGGGKILQVVSTSKTDTFSTSSSGFNDVTGLSATITPSSTSSKIFISLSAHTHTASSSNGANSALRLMRDSTIIAVGDAASGQAQTTTTTGYSNNNLFASSVSANFLDSPNTTSATTYKVQMQSDGGTAFLNRASGELANTNFQRSISSITVMEVAG